MVNLKLLVEEVAADVAAFRTWANDIDLASLSKEEVDRLVTYWFSFKKVYKDV